MVVVGVLSLHPAEAQRYRRVQAENGDQGLENAVSRVRDRTGGRVLSAETRVLDGRRTHVIRILTDDGRVRRLREDAENGNRRSTRGRR